MNKAEKQALIDLAKKLINHTEQSRDEIPFGLGDDIEGELSLIKIALAELLAEPVAWEVKGIYCHSYEEAKSLYPDREPEPLFKKPEVP